MKTVVIVDDMKFGNNSWKIVHQMEKKVVTGKSILFCR
jgi:hypothetical protein